MVKKGDKINLKDGRTATVTGISLGDFIGDPYPVYFVTSEAEAGFVMSDELQEQNDG